MRNFSQRNMFSSRNHSLGYFFIFTHIDYVEVFLIVYFFASSSALISFTNNLPLYKNLRLYLFLQLLRVYNKRFIAKRQLLRIRMKNNLFLSIGRVKV